MENSSGTLEQGRVLLLGESNALFVGVFPADVHTVKNSFQMAVVRVHDKTGGHPGSADALIGVVREQLLLKLCFAGSVGIRHGFPAETCKKLRFHLFFRNEAGDLLNGRVDGGRILELVEIGENAIIIP